MASVSRPDRCTFGENQLMEKKNITVFREKIKENVNNSVNIMSILTLFELILRPWRF
jgi:hypothetical protein